MIKHTVSMLSAIQTPQIHLLAVAFALKTEDFLPKKDSNKVFCLCVGFNLK